MPKFGIVVSLAVLPVARPHHFPVIAKPSFFRKKCNANKKNPEKILPENPCGRVCRQTFQTLSLSTHLVSSLLSSRRCLVEVQFSSNSHLRPIEVSSKSRRSRGLVHVSMSRRNPIRSSKLVFVKSFVEIEVSSSSKSRRGQILAEVEGLIEVENEIEVSPKSKVR